MNGPYDYEEYWEARLAARFDLTGAGYAALGLRHNVRMYHARMRALERALAVANYSLRGARVLEVGCGTGFYTHHCSQQGVSSYVGVDIAAISVETLRRRYPQFTFLRADVTDETVGLKAVFDIVLVADVVFHIVDDERFRVAMQNICRCVGPNGLLILSDVFPSCTVQIAPHCRHRSFHEYKEIIALHGMCIGHIEPIFAILQPPPMIPDASAPWRAYSWLWRYGWRLARGPLADLLLPRMLGWLDEHILLPRLGLGAPNSKWLSAVRI